MRVLKRERFMEAWVIAEHVLPLEVVDWVGWLPNDHVVVVSPREPHHCVVLPADDCVVIRSEVGCLYAVTRADYRAKYTPENEL